MPFEYQSGNLSGELHLNKYEFFLMAMISLRQFLKLMSLSFNSVDSLLFP